jgi:hypothetical protein
VSVVPDSSLDDIPTGDPLLDAEADGNLLKGSSAGVYVMEGGLRRLIPSPEVLISCGYGWDAVRSIPESRLNAIATGASISGPPCPHLVPPDGTLIQGSTGTLYVMEGGLKRRIIDPGVFTACSYLSGNVNSIADSSLAAIPTGDDLAGAPCP